MKVLVVEDEAIIRKGILTSMDWEAMGVNNVKEAKNGKEALEIIRTFFPEVVLTDIRMPVMDGLALAEEINHSHPDIYTILLSGYQEFEYAQKAIKYGVTEYLTKPVGKEDLKEAITKIRSKGNIGKGEMRWGEELFLRYVRKMDREKSLETLEHFFSMVRSQKIPVAQIRTYCVSLLISIEKEIPFSYKMDVDKHLSNMERYGNEKGILTYVQEVVGECLDAGGQLKEKKFSPIVKNSISFIERFYENPVTLEALAKHSYVSPSHLSKIFKKETGMTFVKWLNAYRIDKAKELFRDEPAVPVYLVAEKVGYRDYKYFVRVFKKIEGTTPKHYREGITNDL